MEGARVGLFEDSKQWAELVTEIVGDEGHTVTVKAATIEEARSVIDGLEEGSLDVAIVDGNLNPNTSSGADGVEVTRLLREKVGAVTVIGFSGGNDIPGVDHSVSKVKRPDRDIPAIISAI